MKKKPAKKKDSAVNVGEGSGVGEIKAVGTVYGNVYIGTNPHPQPKKEPQQHSRKPFFLMVLVIVASGGVAGLAIYLSINDPPITGSAERPGKDKLGIHAPPIVIGPSAERWTNSLGMILVPVPGTEVLFSIYLTQIRDYQVFAEENTNINQFWIKPPPVDGQAPGSSFLQGSNHPAVHIAFPDATNFCHWLTIREQRAGRIRDTQYYSLPTDREWSTAVGLPFEAEPIPRTRRNSHKTRIYPWGTNWPPQDFTANLADAAFSKMFPTGRFIPGYHDGFAFTSPVDQFPPNRYGLYDMAGNASQWCLDVLDPDNDPKGLTNTLRGSHFRSPDEEFIRSYTRGGYHPAGARTASYGFRCVLAENASDRKYGR